MAARTVQTGDDVEYALAFLAKRQGTTPEELFLTMLGKVFQEKLKEADDARYTQITELLKNTNKGEAVLKIRELLVG